MKKILIIIVLILSMFFLYGCESKVYLNLYIFEGDYSSYEEKDNEFIIVNNENELLEIKSKNKTLDENGKNDLEISHMQAYYKKNKIGFLYKVANEDGYEFLFDYNTDLDNWFKTNKLLYCSITTTSSGYKCEVYLKKAKDKTSILVLDKFNKFQGDGDDEIKTYNFFVSLTNDEIENLSIILDTETKDFNFKGSKINEREVKENFRECT